MTFSARNTYVWTCEGCQRRQTKERWLLVDAQEQPEVLAHPEELVEIGCPDCGHTSTVEAPCVIARPGHVPPLLIVLPDRAGASESVAALVRQIAKSLAASSVGRVYFPIRVPGGLLPTVLRRDVRHDINDIEGACGAVPWRSASERERYRTFLEAARAEYVRTRMLEVFAGFLGAAPADQASFVSAYPELGSDLAIWALEVTREKRTHLKGVLDRLLAVARDVRAGCPPNEVVERFAAGGEKFGAHVEESYRRALAAADAAAGPAGIGPVREALRIARDRGDEAAEIHLSIELSARIGRKPSASSKDYDEIIALCSNVVDRVMAGSREYSTALMSIGLAYGARSDGDLLENWRLGGGYLMRAADVDRSAHPDLWAKAQMNLGLHVSRHPYGRGDLDKAVARVRASLEEQSPDKNVVDWAYSQINLAHLLMKRDQSAEAAAEAESSYREVLRHLRRDADPRLWTALRHDLAAVLLRKDPADLDGAAQLISDVLDQDPATVDPLTAAEFHELAAESQDRRADRDTWEAAEHRLRALTLVPSDAHPRVHLKIGGKLMGQLFVLGDVQRAADVGESALGALELLFAAQTTPRGRSEFLKDYSRLTRWAVFQLAAAGRPRTAIEAIERGLARELSMATGRDTASLDDVRARAPELAERYEAAWAALRDASGEGSSATTDLTAAERRLRQVTDEIRETDGCSGFLRPLGIADIHEAVGRRPVVYIVNAPWGTCILTVLADTEGRAQATARVIREVTSATVAGLLLVDPDGMDGIGLMALDLTDPIRRARLLPKALERLHKLRPLAEVLASTMAARHDRRIVVVPTGVLGLLPLHAIPVAGPAERLLDDVGEMLLTPCAAVFAAALSRADRTRPARLVGLADPTPTFSLPASRAELKAIARLFEQAGRTASTQEGDAATKRWLASHIAEATHLHLACHGSRRYLKPGGPVLYLADDDALDLGSLERLRISCRTVVISGCHSGHFDTALIPDEFTGLPGGFLQAGAACVISSLWSVDDGATALLMVRFYELLEPSRPGGGMLPGAALRSARQWLRSLTAEAAAAYTERHPELSLIDLDSYARGEDSDLLFDRPRYWAAFSAWGF